MTTWQPLSQRTEGLQPDGPYEGVPNHLVAPLARWYVDASKDRDGRWVNGLQNKMANLLRVAVSESWHNGDVSTHLLYVVKKDRDKFLDLVDCRLHLGGYTRSFILQEALTSGGSVWKVNEDSTGLERRASEELSETVQAATSPSDEASNQLREAWSNAYGRSGDPSDAWDHAIKAVEALLCPAVVPNKAKPTLGDVLGTLRGNNGNKWRGSLPGKDKDHPVTPVVGALELLWPNPDRHGEPNPRPPSAEEARSVVALAAALIQAHRETPIVFKKSAE